MEVALYIHIPFCLQRCTYCDFNTYAGILDLRAAYADAVQHEIRQMAERYPDIAIASVYFGGGTPSLLAPIKIPNILHTIRQSFPLATNAEITLEANPGTVNTEALTALIAAGVCRLSFGVQSVHADELRLLGRIHTWEDAVAAVALARRSGFDNISLDLMFGLPGQTLRQWEQTLEQVLNLTPQHLSLYALTVEPGTPLADALDSKRYPTPDPDLGADMYEIASARLLAAGFWQYEISNWARGQTPAPGIWALPPEGISEKIGPWICRHNLVYWRNQPWLGAGAGAHSWFGNRRWSNPLHPRDYTAAIQAGIATAQQDEVIPPALAQGETMMMGLRLAEGVGNARFNQRFGHDLTEQYGATLQRLQTTGLVEWDTERVRLSAKGRLLGNQVFGAFLP
ncbi:MAG: radical SAM family heme chaperone HemW [Anaerolineae bacterium]|nr:radical SAM family heme chaperone HemW [Anaerolineae bacterium]